MKLEQRRFEHRAARSAGPGDFEEKKSRRFEPELHVDTVGHGLEFPNRLTELLARLGIQPEVPCFKPLLFTQDI